jgi:hypothetical protein
MPLIVNDALGVLRWSENRKLSSNQDKPRSGTETQTDRDIATLRTHSS